jgi:hypothetical protein
VAPLSDSNLTIRKADLGSLLCFVNNRLQLVPLKVTSFASFRGNRPEVEIGRKSRYVGEIASQFNRPSPVCYLCSVNIARPALAVSSYKWNLTGSGNQPQMATPSRSNLTIRWIDLNLMLSKHSSSSICHLQVVSALTNREIGPEAGITGRWRHIAEVTGPFDRPTPVCYWCSVDISLLALTDLKLFALFEVVKTDRKRKPPLGGAAKRK